MCLEMIAMDKNVVFSVIIPVYNTEKYLSRCIESVLKQTYTNFELLLIEDGSPDNCGEICDCYARLDSRIKVFHKSNGGVSSARNMGLDNAKGNYICFIDSDDYVGERYLEIHLPNKDEDFIQSGVMILKNNYLKEYMNHNELFSDYNKFWMQSRQVWPTKCCFSKKIIDKYNLRFDHELTLGEDSLFNHIFICKCDLIRRTKENEYFYNNDNLNSISHKYYNNRLEQQEYLVKKLEKYFDKDQMYRMRWDYWHEILNHYKIKGLTHKNREIRSNAKKMIKETYKSKIFRSCIYNMRLNGSLDEKIETYFMSYYTNWMYKNIINVLKIYALCKKKL